MKQPQTRASPYEEMTTVQKTVAETVDFYLSNGGADVARAKIDNLADTLFFMDGWKQAYSWGMAKIDAFEKAERIKAEEREQQRLVNMMMTMMGIAQQSVTHQNALSTTPSKPDLSDDNICRCLELLMREEWKPGERLFNKQTHWQAVFRIMSDAGLFADDDFDGFDSWVKRTIPSELRRLYSKQSVKNITQTLFCKPFRQWKYDSTLMKKRDPFDRMKRIAERFEQLLNERG